MSETATEPCPHDDLLESSDGDSIECQNCGRGPVDLVDDMRSELTRLRAELAEVRGAVRVACERADSEREARVAVEAKLAEEVARYRDRDESAAHWCAEEYRQRKRADAAEARAREAEERLDRALMLISEETETSHAAILTRIDRWIADDARTHLPAPQGGIVGIRWAGRCELCDWEGPASAWAYDEDSRPICPACGRDLHAAPQGGHEEGCRVEDGPGEPCDCGTRAAPQGGDGGRVDEPEWDECAACGGPCWGRPVFECSGNRFIHQDCAQPTPPPDRDGAGTQDSGDDR